MLSVVIPNYNRLEYLRVKLQSIFYQSVIRQLSILVVDYSEKDDVERYCKEQNVKCVRVKKPFNISHARNVGIRESKTKWVCISGNDTIVEKDFFAKLLFLVKKSTICRYKCIFIAAGFNAPRCELVKLLLSNNCSLNDVYNEFLLLCENNMRWADKDEACLRTRAAGFHTFEKYVAHGLSGYDESFRRWGTEDLDFLGRASSQHIKVIPTRLPFYHLSHPRDNLWYTPDKSYASRKLFDNTFNIFKQKCWGEI